MVKNGDGTDGGRPRLRLRGSNGLRRVWNGAVLPDRELNSHGRKWKAFTLALAAAVLDGDRSEAKRLALVMNMSSGSQR